MVTLAELAPRAYGLLSLGCLWVGCVWWALQSDRRTR